MAVICKGSLNIMHKITLNINVLKDIAQAKDKIQGVLK